MVPRVLFDSNFPKHFLNFLLIFSLKDFFLSVFFICIVEKIRKQKPLSTSPSRGRPGERAGVGTTVPFVSHTGSEAAGRPSCAHVVGEDGVSHITIQLALGKDPE